MEFCSEYQEDCPLLPDGFSGGAGHGYEATCILEIELEEIVACTGYGYVNEI